jgi:translation initiation factor RLI1
LTVDAGSFTESEIIVLLGENGTGENGTIQEEKSI